MAEEYAVFKAAVLDGTTPTGRDTPAVRSAAAADYLEQAASLAASAEDSARTRVDKCTAELAAAEDSLTVATAARQAADAAAVMGRQVADEFAPNTQAVAGVATAGGSA